MPQRHPSETCPSTDAERLTVYRLVAVLALVVIAATFPDPAVRAVAGVTAVGVALGEVLFRDGGRPAVAAFHRLRWVRPPAVEGGPAGALEPEACTAFAAEMAALPVAADDGVARTHRRMIDAFVGTLDALPTAERRRDGDG